MTKEGKATSPDSEKGEPPKETKAKKKMAREVGGPKGLEPTRYGDWERKGITSDF